ncbi:MAG: FAD-dependent oxidoreductase [Endomicrobiales bacterium]
MNIIIVGGGFAGRSAAMAMKSLHRRDPAAKITLFDKYPYTTMKPSLPMVVSGGLGFNAVTGITKNLIPEFVDFRQEEVLGVDLPSKTVSTPVGTYPYDYLVLACGSVTNLRGFNQSLESVYLLDTMDDAMRMQCAYIDYLKKTEHPVVFVTGGGYTGLEIAGELFRLGQRLNKKPKIIVAEAGKEILGVAEEKIRTYITKYITGLGFQTMTNALVTSFDGKNVTLKSGEKFTDVFFCWCAGTKIAIDGIKGDYEVIGDKRFLVNDYLQVPRYPEVFAPADTGTPHYKGGYLRKSVNFALHSGWCAGVNTGRLALGMPMRKYSQTDLGVILPIYNVSAGRALNFQVSGKLGLSMHYFMSGYRNYSIVNALQYFTRALFPEG